MVILISTELLKLYIIDLQEVILRKFCKLYKVKDTVKHLQPPWHFLCLSLSAVFLNLKYIGVLENYRCHLHHAVIT